jgi:type II secretory ATPase GspE/PulE/Tfp pilus assembly ATPase PilB-like protein
MKGKIRGMNAKTNHPSSPTAPAPPTHVDQVPAWLAQAVVWAQGRGATDLHFFPAEGAAALWARIDGELVEVTRHTPAIHARLVARLKVLGRCTEYQGELVQEGRFAIEGPEGAIEARLSILPTMQGEKAVVRLLTGGARLRRLDDLGYGEGVVAALRQAAAAPQGLILAVGPSGSGKSTAIYALLADLAERAGRPLSILTVEDPIEQTLPMAAQVAADPARGLGFAACLRVLLRQDPEVIMIGEIRDAETARTALEAALTGHRLLSSMHTLSAAEALVRLAQMGAPPYVIASALAGVLSVRLVRLLCEQCRRTRPPTTVELEALPEACGALRIADCGWTIDDFDSQSPIPNPQSPIPNLESSIVNRQSTIDNCPACLGSGHRGRTGLAEWLVPTEATMSALAAHEPSSGLAATLKLAASARPAALDLMREGRLAPGEWLRLAGFASLARPKDMSASSLKPPVSEFQVSSSEFQVSSSEFQVSSSEFQVSSSEFQVPSLVNQSLNPQSSIVNHQSSIVRGGA